MAGDQIIQDAQNTAKEAEKEANKRQDDLKYQATEVNKDAEKAKDDAKQGINGAQDQV